MRGFGGCDFFLAPPPKGRESICEKKKSSKRKTRGVKKSRHRPEKKKGGQRGSSTDVGGGGDCLDVSIIITDLEKEKKNQMPFIYSTQLTVLLKRGDLPSACESNHIYSGHVEMNFYLIINTLGAREIGMILILQKPYPKQLRSLFLSLSLSYNSS